jgi:hypothetical protein
LSEQGGPPHLAREFSTSGSRYSKSSNTPRCPPKRSDNWELARDKDTKTTGEFKKGDKVTIKYKMTATNIEGPKVKADIKADTKTKVDAKTK